jgi:signal transduction histidine kinase
LQIREEERKRIGREIHDELGQQLTAIKMDIAWIDKKIPEESDALKSKLKNVIQLLDGSNQSIRRILSELRPSILDEHGLPEALEWLSRRFTENTGINATFTSNFPRIKLSEAVNTCVYRIYQEALTNITRYAKATQVTAMLTLNNDLLHFEVEDNGIGFDLHAQPPKKSFGLLGIKERAGGVGGNFHIISEPGAGTKIIIEIPVTT